MHPAALEAMARMLPPDLTSQLVLDAGSLDVNGTYRPLVEKRGGRYVGLDLVQGSNVDVVSPDPYCYPFPDGYFDVVLSGSVMEHVERPWLWVPELARVLKPGGWLCLVTHWCFPLHRYPVDCWRILPDGMQVLFDDTGGLTEYEVGLTNDQDVYARARKRL